MSPRFLIVALGLLACRINAATLTGVVLENNLGGRTASNIEISAEGASPTVTDHFGQFRLKFPSKAPGELIRLLINRPGYTVVNHYLLEQRLPLDGDTNPLVLLICKDESIDEWRRQFYQVNCRGVIDEHYRQKEIQVRTNAAERATLDTDRSKALATADKFSAELARYSGMSSSAYQEAMRLFLQGKIDQALALLNDQELQRRRESAENQKRQAETELEEVARSHTLRACLLTTQFRFTEANRAHETALEIAPHSFDANFIFGHFHEELGHNRQAADTYRRCVSIAKKRRSTEDLGFALNQLGIVSEKMGNFDDAEGAYKEAMTNQLALITSSAKGPVRYLVSLVDILNNYGILLTLKRDRTAAGFLTDALTRSRELAAIDEGAFSSLVAMTLCNLSRCRVWPREGDLALKEAEEARQIYQRLAAGDPTSYQPHLAKSLNNLAVAQFAKGQLTNAVTNAEKALVLKRDLARANPDGNSRDLISTLAVLGRIRIAMNRCSDALTNFQEAVALYQRHIGGGEELLEQIMVDLLDGYAEAFFDCGDVKTSEHFARDAINPARALVVKDTKRYELLLAKCVAALRVVEFRKKQTKAAKGKLQEAKETLIAVAKENPFAFPILSKIENVLNEALVTPEN